MKEVTTIGIDLAKNVFQVHGVNKAGKVVLRKRVSRVGLERLMREQESCVVGLEACGGSHYWGRLIRAMGHDVRLISPQFVKPYVKSNKNDAHDAEAICEAVSRPSMRFVAIKDIEQQDILSLHRVRERLVKSRTALVNEVRGLFNEYGIVMPQGVSSFRRWMKQFVVCEDTRVSPTFRGLIDELWQEFVQIDDRLKRSTDQIEALGSQDEVCRRLETIPGIGPLTASAMVASIGDPRGFKNGRQVSAWLGLVPKQHSSGGKSKLLGISKRGDKYLRRLLIHGARAVLRFAKDKQDKQSLWLNKLQERRGFNKACVALANKNARTIWALMISEQVYRSHNTSLSEAA